MLSKILSSLAEHLLVEFLLLTSEAVSGLTSFTEGSAELSLSPSGKTIPGSSGCLWAEKSLDILSALGSNSLELSRNLDEELLPLGLNTSVSGLVVQGPEIDGILVPLNNDVGSG